MISFVFPGLLHGPQERLCSSTYWFPPWTGRGPPSSAGSQSQSLELRGAARRVNKEFPGPFRVCYHLSTLSQERWERLGPHRLGCQQASQSYVPSRHSHRSQKDSVYHSRTVRGVFLYYLVGSVLVGSL